MKIFSFIVILFFRKKKYIYKKAFIVEDFIKFLASFEALIKRFELIIRTQQLKSILMI
jgi:hypothetical protein